MDIQRFLDLDGDVLHHIASFSALKEFAKVEFTLKTSKLKNSYFQQLYGHGLTFFNEEVDVLRADILKWIMGRNIGVAAIKAGPDPHFGVAAPNTCKQLRKLWCTNMSSVHTIEWLSPFRNITHFYTDNALIINAEDFFKAIKSLSELKFLHFDLLFSKQTNIREICSIPNLQELHLFRKGFCKPFVLNEEEILEVVMNSHEFPKWKDFSLQYSLHFDAIDGAKLSKLPKNFLITTLRHMTVEVVHALSFVCPNVTELEVVYYDIVVVTPNMIDDIAKNLKNLKELSYDARGHGMIDYDPFFHHCHKLINVTLKNTRIDMENWHELIKNWPDLTSLTIDNFVFSAARNVAQEQFTRLLKSIKQGCPRFKELAVGLPKMIPDGFEFNSTVIVALADLNLASLKVRIGRFYESNPNIFLAIGKLHNLETVELNLGDSMSIDCIEGIFYACHKVKYLTLHPCDISERLLAAVAVSLGKTLVEFNIMDTRHTDPTRNEFQWSALTDFLGRMDKLKVCAVTLHNKKYSVDAAFKAIEVEKRKGKIRRNMKITVKVE